MAVPHNKIKAIKMQVINDLEGALKAFAALCEKEEALKEFENEIIDLQSRYTGYSTQVRRNLLSEENRKREESQIRNAFLDLLTVTSNIAPKHQGTELKVRERKMLAWIISSVIAVLGIVSTKFMLNNLAKEPIDPKDNSVFNHADTVNSEHKINKDQVSKDIVTKPSQKSIYKNTLGLKMCNMSGTLIYREGVQQQPIADVILYFEGKEVGRTGRHGQFSISVPVKGDQPYQIRIRCLKEGDSTLHAEMQEYICKQNIVFYITKQN